MKSSEPSLINTKSLVRDIINIFWIVIGLYVIATSINMYFTSYEKWMFFRGVVVVPTIYLISVIIITEVIFKYLKRNIEYLIIVAVTVMVSIIILALYTKPITIFLLVLPSLFSLYFLKPKLLKFASFSGIIAFILICIISESVRSNINMSDFILILSLIVGFSALINSLLKHSFRLMNELIKSTKENQDLFSRNIHMERLTHIDPVTELYNHRSFHEHLESIFKLESPEATNLHLAILDIDNFKQVNDTFGHSAGDSVIIEVAQQIKSLTGSDDFPSRYGGEEFAIISTDLSTEEFLTKIETIRENIANLVLEELCGKSITVSAGIQKLSNGMNKQELFNGADLALYQAKRTGKDRTIVNDGEYK